MKSGINGSASGIEGDLIDGFEHEELLVHKGRRTGAYVAIAVHSTTLGRGRASGGIRLYRYASPLQGAQDALRLSRAMTYKFAAAGIPLGGGKSVICAEAGPPPSGRRRHALLMDFADALNALGGRYVAGGDVGIESSDMEVLATASEHVFGLDHSRGGSGDSSDPTAVGVKAAIQACCESLFGSRRLEGRSVAVIGLGKVGSKLARQLSDEGARLVLSDVEPSKRSMAEELPYARWVEPSAALCADVDVLAPCALGGVIDEGTVGRLRCRIVCGAANNQLAHDALAEDLAARSILYAPDFVANSGGAIHVFSIEVARHSVAEARRRAGSVGHAMAQVLREADARGSTPLMAAYGLARSRLRAAVAEPTNGCYTNTSE